MAGLRPTSGDDIRAAFLGFFEERSHLVMPSASLIPAGDPTLLLTSAGMVPFKPYFAGEAAPPGPRLTSVQKCFRTTDIDSVGDESHLTFFEMLGNFSVGDYFKREAIAWAWEFVTGVLELPPERLWATVYLDGDDAQRLWEETGVPAERIRRFGEKENYWGPAGTEGPCGPCSEVHYDFGGPCRVGKSDADCGPNCECGRFLELWNLVFMQFYQDPGGGRTPLPAPNVDTGMGLERTAAVMQQKPSIYETDLFAPIVAAVESLSGVRYGKDPEADYAIRVVAEHARSAAFLIADGVAPSNEGRGYVLRRIIRRAVRFARKLGVQGPFLGRVAEAVIEQMGAQYPELEEHRRFVLRALELEEEQFSSAIAVGLPFLEELIRLRPSAGSAYSGTFTPTSGALVSEVAQALRQGSRAARLLSEISGREAFFLFDTYGFPLELTQEIAREHSLEVDVEGFEREMEAQRARGRAAGQKFGGGRDVQRAYEALGVDATDFLGYDTVDAESVVVGMLADGAPVQRAGQGQRVELVLRETPFYPEGGGQVGDTGVIEAPGGRLQVHDTQRPVGELIVHDALVERGEIAVGDSVRAMVDSPRREDVARNHTGTHLLHAALRKVLGTHVRQAGSLVAPDRLRFDFTHVAPVTPDELRQIQGMINEAVLQNLSVTKRETTFREAVAQGALAFFGEQYGDRVRVLEVAPSRSGEGNGDVQPFSFEVCGGTHVDHSGDIGYFRITGETGIGTGVRRIEAVTGRGAEDWVDQRLGWLEAVAGRLHAAPPEVPQRVDALLEEVERSRKEAAATQRDASRRQADELLDEVRQVDGVSVLAAQASVPTVEALREMGDRLRDKMGSGIVVLGGVFDDRPTLVAMVTKDLVSRGYRAGEIVQAAAKLMGGGGGGRPEVAQAGGREPQRLAAALEAAVELVREKGG